ncbi:hypothetical protein LSAT2_001300 [Lamellibrachia satsuma]|nr:hypothetical protein LSAT2_001300 [Lamellibrachia satsuma]
MWLPFDIVACRHQSPPFTASHRWRYNDRFGGNAIPSCRRDADGLVCLAHAARSVAARPPRDGGSRCTMSASTAPPVTDSRRLIAAVLGYRLISRHRQRRSQVVQLIVARMQLCYFEQ